MATIEDLVRVSGYSRSTVFRYLGGKPVRDAAREAIRAAVRATGFRTLLGDTREEDRLLISLPADFRGFRGFADVVEGIMGRAAECGVPVTFDEGQCAGKRAAALIVGKSMDEENEERRRRAASGIPCVLVNRYLDEADASWVSADFRAAGADAVARLAEAGCRRIACYGARQGRRVDMHKVEGGRLKALERGIDFILIDPDTEALEASCERLISGPDRVDGWMSLNDLNAMRVISCAGRLGVAVPGDLSVIGMNDVEGTAYTLPPITTVRIPFRECGAAAVDAALRLLDHPEELSVKVVLRHRLIERESCRPASIG